MKKTPVYHSRMLRGYAGSLTSALNASVNGAFVEIDVGTAQGIRETLLEWARRMDREPEDQPPVDRKDWEADQAREVASGNGRFTTQQIAEMQEEDQAHFRRAKEPPFADPKRIDRVAEKLGLDLGQAVTGQLMQNFLIPILEALTDRIIALEKDDTPVEEAVAARCAFDGYGWRYLDTGSGPDWKTRAAQYPDCEWLYNRGVT